MDRLSVFDTPDLLVTLRVSPFWSNYFKRVCNVPEIEKRVETLDDNLLVAFGKANDDDYSRVVVAELKDGCYHIIFLSGFHQDDPTLVDTIQDLASFTERRFTLRVPKEPTTTNH